MMLKSKNRKLVNELARNLYYIAIDNSYDDRSRVALHIFDLIYKIGSDIETYFEMDYRYVVTDAGKFAKIKNRLRDVLDINDQSVRSTESLEFYEWLHEIKLLRDR